MLMAPAHQWSANRDNAFSLQQRSFRCQPIVGRIAAEAAVGGNYPMTRNDQRVPICPHHRTHGPGSPGFSTLRCHLAVGKSRSPGDAATTPKDLPLKLSASCPVDLDGVKTNCFPTCKSFKQLTGVSHHGRFFLQPVTARPQQRDCRLRVPLSKAESLEPVASPNSCHPIELGFKDVPAETRRPCLAHRPDFLGRESIASNVSAWPSSCPCGPWPAYCFPPGHAIRCSR